MSLNVQGNFKKGGNSVEFNLPIITFQEEGLYFYYTPVLDLTGYGKTDEEAKTSFEETISQFFDYAINKKTLFAELKKLGWKVSNRSVSKPPSLVDMLNKNNYLAEIFEEKQYKKFNHTVSIPAFA